MDNKNLSQPNESVVGSRNIIMIALFVLITALVVGGAVYVWQKSLLNRAEQSLQTEITALQSQIKKLQSTIMEQEQPVATQKENNKEQDSTKSTTSNNWKTYSSKELGYSIDYPNNWEVKEYNKGEVYISYPGWRQMPEGGGSVVISVEDKTLEKFIEEYNASDVLDDGTPLSKIVKQKSYTLNGINGYKLVGTTAIGLAQSFIFISRANKSYIIRFQEYDNSHLEIIKTFRLN